MEYDLIVIGGGPAGMIAAGRAAELGVKVALIEKNATLGRKLLSTGGGRCNFSNVLFSDRELASKYGQNGKFLLSAFNLLNPIKTVDFFKNLGVKSKIEADGRVFPESDQAIEVLKALIGYLDRGRVEVITGSAVKDFRKNKKIINSVILEDGREIVADKFIIAVGGKSYQNLGSSGDGYDWLEKMGHKIIPPVPGLASILVKERGIKNLEGVSLKKAKLTALSDNKKIAEAVGDLIFTFKGISGPVVLNLSGEISRQSEKDIKLEIDLFPELSDKELSEKLQKLFEANGGKNIRNLLTLLTPVKLVDDILNKAGINPGKKASLISRPEKLTIVDLMKRFDWSFKSTAGFNEAMITVGGVDSKEIDQRTMKSKLVDNLFIAGEIIDLQGPTGGYNLQLCWSTGYLAGEASTR